MLSQELSEALSRYSEAASIQTGRDYGALFEYAYRSLLKHGMVCARTLKEFGDERWHATKLPVGMLSCLLEELSSASEVNEGTPDIEKPIDRIMAAWREELLAKSEGCEDPDTYLEKDHSYGEGSRDNQSQNLFNAARHSETSASATRCAEYFLVSELYWSHDRIYDHFSDDRSVFETVCDLLNDTDVNQQEIYVDRLPCLQVIDIQNRLYSISNRRLYALREYEKILTRLVGQRKIWVRGSKVTLDSGTAFTTKCCGEQVALSRPVKVSFARHEKGARVLSTERIRSLSRGASVERSAQVHSGRCGSRSRLCGTTNGDASIPMPEIMEEDFEVHASSGRSPPRGRMPSPPRSRQRERSPQRHAFNASHEAWQRERSHQNTSAWASVPRSEPWWVNVAKQPSVSEDQLSEFASRWDFDRWNVAMLRNLRPGLLHLVIRDFRPPPYYKRGYDTLLKSFVQGALWKLDLVESAGARGIRRSVGGQQLWRDFREPFKDK